MRRPASIRGSRNSVTMAVAGGLYCLCRHRHASAASAKSSGTTAGAASITGLQFCFQGGPSFTCCAQARLLRPNPSLGLLFSVWASVLFADLNAMDTEQQVLLQCVQQPSRAAPITVPYFRSLQQDLLDLRVALEWRDCRLPGT